jgi:hypothetical protein
MGEEEKKDSEQESEQRNEGSEQSKGGTETVDISDTPAPSIGPHTTFDKRSPEERLAGHEQSGKDAMGLDKRRQVSGGTYGPTVTRQVVSWLIFAVVVAGAAFGLKTLADDLDKPPAKVEDQAPWTGSDQKPDPLQ